MTPAERVAAMRAGFAIACENAYAYEKNTARSEARIAWADAEAELEKACAEILAQEARR